MKVDIATLAANREGRARDNLRDLEDEGRHVHRAAGRIRIDTTTSTVLRLKIDK